MVFVGLLTDPPSAVLQQLLIDGSLGVMPTNPIAGGTNGASSDWPIFRSNIPDLPDNCIVTYDTGNIQQGRYMTDGAYADRPGLMVKVRSHTYDTGWEKSKRIAAYLDESVRQTQATVGSNDYLVVAFSRTSGPLSLGKEVARTSGVTGIARGEGVSKRYLFSINGTVAIYQEPYGSIA